MSDIIYREATPADWDAAMELAWRTFLKYEAPEYLPEGIQNFKDFIFDDRLRLFFINGDYIMYVAEKSGSIIGLVSLRNINHISLLFVDELYHRQGIGRQLINCLANRLRHSFAVTEMTVNAAPYAEGFYHKIGFIDRGLRTTRDGIIYTPMELYL